MTDNPFKDAVAIDTNVFEHILNPQENVNNHISELLAYLQERNTYLIVDDGNRIYGEYDNKLTPMIENADDIGPELYLLRYWFLDAPSKDVNVTLNDSLMTRIKRVIHEPSENVDRIFVYVAFKRGNLLISNDRNHIVIGPDSEAGQSERRHRLIRETRRMYEPGAAILTSQEAQEKIPT